jgi:TonB family protein
MLRLALALHILCLGRLVTIQAPDPSKTEVGRMRSIASCDSETLAAGGTPDRGRNRYRLALLASGAAHLGALLFLCWPARPVVLTPNWVARGEGGTSAPTAISLYLPQDYQKQAQQPVRVLLAKTTQTQARKVKTTRRHNLLGQETAGSREIGSPLGSASGQADGDEVRPALPVTFADPQIFRWDAPSGVQGDVVVEITIDVQGNVTETRLLEGVGYGIDQKVIAAAREWHFRPATRNGIAVPSKQDYRFHFPS